MSPSLDLHTNIVQPYNSSGCGAYNEKGFKIPDQKYGSLGNTPSLVDLNESRRRDSVCTTVGDDNDEGLYLMSTHQLLREKGFAPASVCRELEGLYSDIRDKKNNDKIDDDESSISDMSSEDEDEDSQYEQRCKLFTPVASSLDFTSYSYQASMTSRPSIRNSSSRSHIYQEIEDNDSNTITSNTSFISKYLFPIKCGCL
ncbi:hypothetical protein BDB01DRAFT_775776 [Pilobolus umbonatus]|nr:hypothetical protein BDB01DRAFT_775776 [Pilobolus umbonatus]